MFVFLEAQHNLKPWGLFGISFVVLAVVLVALSIFVGRKLHKSERLFNTIILVFSLIFISMEITHEVSRYFEFGSYDWSSFPFQMCSVTMYIALLVPFLKKGKLKDYFVMFFATFTFLSGILPLIFAQGNLFRWNTIGGVLFSFIWHILLLMLGGFAIGYNRVGKSLKAELKPLIASFIIFILITCIAQVLNTGIHFLVGGDVVEAGVIKHAGYKPQYELDPDSASLFYISPFFQSNIGVVFDSIWLNAGWHVCWLVYDLAFEVGALLVYFSAYGITRLPLLFKRKESEDIKSV